MTTYPPFLRRGILAASFLAYSALGRAGAQDASSVQKPDTGITVLRKNVRRVLVDVIVTGPHDEPVHGLTKDDFTVLEDGKQQTIRSFDVHDFNEPLESLPSVPPMPPNTFLNLPHELERGPLFVLLYDMVNIEPEDQPYARAQLLRFIQNKPAGTRFAVIVISDGMHLLQGFTEDKSKLLALLDSHSNKPHVPEIFLMGRNNGRGDTSFSIDAFTELAHYLEGFSGRKDVLWFSGKFPLSLFANFDNQLKGDGDYTEKTKDLVDTLAHNQIAIYPVDVKGVVTTEVFAPTGAAGPGGGMSTDYRTGNGNQGSSSGAPSNPNAGPGSNAPPSAAAAASSSGSTIAAGGPGYSQTNSEYQAIDELAKQTGGRAFYSRNDLATALESAVETGSNYYTVSYSPTNENYNGKLRKISVELAKKGYKLSYRRSYFGVDQDSRSPSTDATLPVELAGSHSSIPQDDPLSVAMRHGGPMAHDLIFRAQVHTVGQPAMATPEQMSRLVQDAGALRRHKQNAQPKPAKPISLQSYSIDYRVQNIQPSASSPDSARPATIEISAAAFDADGHMLSGVLQDAVRNSPANQPAAKNAAFFSVQQQLDVPVKAAWIRLAVRDLSTNRVGTLEVPLPLAPESSTASTGSAPSPAHPH